MLIHFCSPPYAKIIAKPEGTFSTLFAEIARCHYTIIQHTLSMQKYEQAKKLPNSIALGAIRGLLYFLAKCNGYLAVVLQGIYQRLSL
jgi:hypothetical protein